MKKIFKTPHRHDEGAITLIELMVMGVLIVVLIAIAIPSFLGFRKSAQDREAQSEILAVLPTTTTVATTTTIVGLSSTDGVYTDANNDDPEIVCYVSTSRSGKTFSVWSRAGDTYYGGGDLSVADCPSTPPYGYQRDGW